MKKEESQQILKIYIYKKKSKNTRNNDMPKNSTTQKKQTTLVSGHTLEKGSLIDIKKLPTKRKSIHNFRGQIKYSPRQIACWYTKQ